MEAAINGHKEIVNILINAGANLQVKNNVKFDCTVCEISIVPCVKFCMFL